MERRRMLRGGNVGAEVGEGGVCIYMCRKDCWRGDVDK